MFNSCSSARLVALFLGSTILVSLTEAAAAPPPSGPLDASKWFAKAAGAAGSVNNTYDYGARDTSDDGCPLGWAECSVDTCYPLDGSTCCSDGNFCEFGLYCDDGGCCPNDDFCDGNAPPPSMLPPFGPTTTPRAVSTHRTVPTSIGSPSTSTFNSGAFTPLPVATSTSVPVAAPAQSTDYGTVTIPTGTSPSGATQTGVGLPADSNTVTDTSSVSSPTGSGLHSGAVSASSVSYAVLTGACLAWVVAVTMCMT